MLTALFILLLIAVPAAATVNPDMKIALICSVIGLLCGHPNMARADGDFTFECPGGAHEFHGGMSDGWRQYKTQDASPGRCRWVVDEDAMKQEAESERRRQELWWALRSRPLTDQEMAEVKQMGVSLTVGSGVSYLEDEKMRELNDALFQQYRLQAEAARQRN